MRDSRALILTIAALLILGLTALPAHAQTPAVSATVDRSALSTDDTLVLTVTVDASNGQPSQPALPALNGFKILGTSSGTQMTLINGVTTTLATYQYNLQPVRPGTLTIEPITVQVGSQTYNTDPITVEVTEGTGQPQPAPNTTAPGSLPPLLQGNVDPMALLNQLDQLMQQAPLGHADPLDPDEAPTELTGQDFFVEGTVDNLNPYQGQQVIYTLRFYRAADPFGQIEYEAPGFTGFWSKQQPGQKDYTTGVAGRNYLVSELQTVLFPTVPGKVTIDPAKLTVPSDFFSRGVVLRTQPVTLDVKPLPADAPASFTGAVGQFTFQSDVDKRETKVGDTITQRVTIDGQGNLETLDDPVWPETPQWRVFDSEPKTETTFENGVFGGTRTYERVMVPTEAGQLTLPAIEFSYFDPAQGSYVTLNSTPVEMSVTADPAATATAPALAAASGLSPEEPANPVSSQPALRPVKAAASRWGSMAAPLTQRPFYWLLWAVPVALLVGQSVWQRRQRHLRVNAHAVRSQKAAKQAHHALKEARKHPAEANSAAGRILTEYIGVKLNRSVVGLTQPALAALLASRGADAGLVERVQTCLMLSEMGRYAPAGYLAPGADLIAETEQVVDALDKQLVVL